MKTFDRAMYAIFLLVLLADVACAQGSMPVGVDASSSGLTLQDMQDAVRMRVGPVVGSARVVRLEGSGSVAPASVARSSGLDLFASYRSAARKYASAHVGAVRGIFDPTWFDAGVSVAALDNADSGLAYVEPVRLDSSARQVFEHFGSPAP